MERKIQKGVRGFPDCGANGAQKMQQREMLCFDEPFRLVKTDIA
jgi:hypothetical protein